jgi:GMP synthase-like glutamine amidotransferase
MPRRSWIKHLPQDVVDGRVVGADQFTDAQRHVASQCGDFLAGLNGVGERLLRLFAHPAHDRDPGVAEHHERVLGKAHDAGELELDDLVQRLQRLVPVDLHACGRGYRGPLRESGRGRPVASSTSPVTTCLVVQHVEPESAFALADALDAEGVDLDVRRIFDGDPVPAVAAGLDGLVVMGGPMSATSDAGFPTRSREISLLADAVRAGIPTLGVCLGAQLLALASGGSVSAGAQGPEIGWAPVTLTPARQADPLFAGFPEAITVLHWHGDTFGLPGGATRLATNTTYANQAFRLGTASWGLQFHLEVTQTAVEGFLHAFGADAEHLPGGAAVIRSATPSSLERLAPVRDEVCRRFAGLVAAGD